MCPVNCAAPMEWAGPMSRESGDTDRGVCNDIDVRPGRVRNGSSDS